MAAQRERPCNTVSKLRPADPLVITHVFGLGDGALTTGTLVTITFTRNSRFPPSVYIKWTALKRTNVADWFLLHSVICMSAGSLNGLPDDLQATLDWLHFIFLSVDRLLGRSFVHESVVNSLTMPHVELV